MIVDGADSFPSRYLLNDASVKLGIPVVHGSIFASRAWSASSTRSRVRPTGTWSPNRRRPSCPSCAEAGVLGVLPGIVGSIQALEAIKVILGLEGAVDRRILTIDTTDMSFRTFNLKPDPAGR